MSLGYGMTAALNLAFLIVLLELISPGAAAQFPVETSRTIRVVMDDDYAPYAFRSDGGKLQGILIDQWQAWERKTGIKIEIKAMDWDEALRRMRAGEFDVIDGIVETVERRNSFDFTPAYVMVEASIYFRNQISGVTDLASLKGFPFGVKAGAKRIDDLKANGVASMILHKNDDAIIDAAKRHALNVFIVDDPSAHYLLHKSGIEGEFRHSEPIARDELRRAVRKGDVATLRAVSDGFAAIEPGELKQINAKWLGHPIHTYGRYLTYAGHAAVVAILLIAVLIGWNRTLRKGILQRTAALGESEQRFRQIAENIREIVWISTPGMDQVLYVSPAYERIWGRSVESLRQRPRSFIEGIHPEDRDRVVGILEAQREQTFEVEYRVVRSDGSVRWIRARAFPVKNQSGRVYRIAGIAEDITERKVADDHLRLVLDTIPTMAWSLLPDGTVDYVNQRWLEYTGLSLEEGLKHANRIVHPEDLPTVIEKWIVDMPAGAPSEYEMRLRRADGEYRWFLVRTVPLSDEQGNLVKWYGTSTDIEDRKRAENALRESEERFRDSGVQLQALSRRLVDLQEYDRKELARELHDRVGQSLTALNINLAILRQGLSGHDAAISARLEDSAALVVSSMRAIENVLSDLRPQMLDDHGLQAALGWYAKQFSARAGINVSVHADEPAERMAADVEIALFRIAQEALNNVAKHARASSVVIRLESQGIEYVMFVKDDGVGLRADEKRSDPLRTGFGMVTMRERAQAVGGRFHVKSLPGGGMQLSVSIPRKSDEPSAFR